jgi:LacI family transcriptional regulator
MKKKVREVADELGYTPNLIAQNLTSKRTFTLGVVIPDLENSFFAYATDSIIDAATDKNYNVFVTVSRENQNSEKLNIQKLIGMRIDGLLVCVSQQSNDPQIFNHIKKLNIPLVFFDRQYEGLNFPSITFDDRNGAIAALEKIIDEGYSKVAHVAGYSSISIGKERIQGFIQALKNKGVEINPDWIIEGGFEVADGYHAFLKLYQSNNLPEIILTVNDRAALGVYHAAKQVGVRIPEDIGIVAFGFNEIAQTFTPPLSIINQNPRKMGLAATNMLIEEIENKNSDEKNQITIEEEFIWNDSILKGR